MSIEVAVVVVVVMTRATKSVVVHSCMVAGFGEVQSACVCVCTCDKRGVSCCTILIFFRLQSFYLTSQGDVWVGISVVREGL